MLFLGIFFLKKKHKEQKHNNKSNFKKRHIMNRTQQLFEEKPATLLDQYREDKVVLENAIDELAQHPVVMPAELERAMRELPEESKQLFLHNRNNFLEEGSVFILFFTFLIIFLFHFRTKTIQFN